MKWFFVNPWIVAYQAPRSMGFSRQEYRSGLPFPSPGDPPNSGIELRSPSVKADNLPSEPPGKSLCNIGLHSETNALGVLSYDYASEMKHG